MSRDLGISYETLRHWLKEERGALRPVAVETSAAPRRESVIVRLGHGVVVDGLDIDGIAELARRLA